MPGQTRRPPMHVQGTASVARETVEGFHSNDDLADRIGVDGAGAATTPTLSLVGAADPQSPLDPGFDPGHLGEWFCREVYDRTVQGLTDFDHFLETLGPRIDEILQQSPSGRILLEAIRWSDNFLQGHGTAKYGKAEFGETNGKHVDENDGVMQADPNAKIDFSHDDVKWGGGPGTFDQMGKTDGLLDILENLQGLSENIDEVLEMAAKLGLIEEPGMGDGGGDDPPVTSTTTTDATPDPTATTTTTTDLKVKQEDGSGNLTPSKHGNFSVQSDGKLSTGPTQLQDASDKGDKTPTVKVDKTPTSGTGLDIDPAELARKGQWTPLNLDYEYYTTNIESYRPRMDGENSVLNYWVRVFDYPDGSYDIVADYAHEQFGLPTIRGKKLLKRCKAGTPLPQGLQKVPYP